jgi:glycosyltransferase involved in cell wall biosynthesis
MARKLRERGFEVVNYNQHRYGDDPCVNIRGEFGMALSHLLLRTNHDVYFTGLSFTPSFCLYLNRQLRNKPYVFNLTSAQWEIFYDRSRGKPFPNLFENRFYPLLLESVLAGASRIVCNSRFVESCVAARYPQHRSRLMTIYNGIEFERYGGGRRQPLPGVGRGDTVLMCATTLNFRNKSRGLELVIDAFGEVNGARKDVKLVIAAKTSHSRYGEWGQEYVKTKPWRDSVVFLFNQNIPDLLASSDLFVFATPHNSNDSLPRVLLEAQSAGLPAVTTDTSGCPEIVRDGTTGFVVPYDAKALAAKILTLLDSPELLADMGKEAREWIGKTFNWDRMADKYADVFMEIGGNRAAVR